MPRSFWIAGVVCLAFALVFSFLASVSLPLLSGLDVTRVDFGENLMASTERSIYQIRFGVWAGCLYYNTGDKFCTEATGQGYITEVERMVIHVSVTIGKSWTRGLAVHPIATAATFAAFVLAFFNHMKIMIFASLTSFLAALLSFLAFAIDLALYAYVHHQMEKLKIPVSISVGRVFWLNFVSLILLMVAGFIVCFGRRKDLMSGSTSSYPLSTGTGFKFTRS